MLKYVIIKKIISVPGSNQLLQNVSYIYLLKHL